MKWDVRDIDKWPWHRHPMGLASLEPGNSVAVNTGSWRSRRPIWNHDKCTHCLRCFIYCPDACIQVQEGKMVGIDYFHCKGCGICAEECNVGALELVEEAQAQAEEKNAQRQSNQACSA